MRNPKVNSSGCRDLTAYEALKNVSNDEDRVHRLIKVLKYIIHVSGFELMGRIELNDRKTGRKYI